jgi:AraC-like DNA-binding protein
MAGFSIVLLTFVNVIMFSTSGTSVTESFGLQLSDIIFLSQQTIACFLCFVVIFISFRELINYQNEIQNELSDLGLIQIRWLWQFVISMSLTTLLWGIEVSRVLMGGTGTSFIVLVTWAILFIFIYYTSYKAFTQKDLFSISPEILIQNNEKPEPAKSESIQNSSDFEETINKLEAAMQVDELFLNANLTIHELAKITGISSRKISQSINSIHQMNFSEWVNGYRVEKAKTLLQNISQNNYTIESIGFDCGFNSRSAMYLAFKNITNKSPGDFKG